MKYVKNYLFYSKVHNIDIWIGGEVSFDQHCIVRRLAGSVNGFVQVNGPVQSMGWSVVFRLPVIFC